MEFVYNLSWGHLRMNGNVHVHVRIGWTGTHKLHSVNKKATDSCLFYISSPRTYTSTSFCFYTQKLVYALLTIPLEILMNRKQITVCLELISDSITGTYMYIGKVISTIERMSSKSAASDVHHTSTCICSCE